MQTGWMVPPRRAHACFSASVTRRSAVAGGVSGVGCGADAEASGVGSDAGDGGAGDSVRDESSVVGTDDAVSIAGRAWGAGLVSTRAGGFGPEAQPTTMMIPIETKARTVGAYPPRADRSCHSESLVRSNSADKPATLS